MPNLSQRTRDSRIDPRHRKRWLEQAVAKNPKSVALLVSLASLRELEGQYQEAERLYRHILDLSQEDIVPLNNLAWLTALRGGKASDALDLINRAIERTGPAPELLDTRAIVYLAAGQNSAAIDDLNKAIASDRSGPKLFHLAQAYLKDKKRDQARTALQEARDAGLVDAGQLHPLEKGSYEQMLADLAQRN